MTYVYLGIVTAGQPGREAAYHDYGRYGIKIVKLEDLYCIRNEILHAKAIDVDRLRGGFTLTRGMAKKVVYHRRKQVHVCEFSADGYVSLGRIEEISRRFMEFTSSYEKAREDNLQAGRQEFEDEVRARNPGREVSFTYLVSPAIAYLYAVIEGRRVSLMHQVGLDEGRRREEPTFYVFPVGHPVDQSHIEEGERVVRCDGWEALGAELEVDSGTLKGRVLWEYQDVDIGRLFGIREEEKA